MTETTTLRKLLLPELEGEFGKTRKMIDNLPDGNGEFKAHEKSMSLARLAGHTADMAGFITAILTTPDLDLAAGGMKPLLYTTKAQLMAEFNELADHAITALKNTSNETFEQDWSVPREGQVDLQGHALRGIPHHGGQSPGASSRAARRVSAPVERACARHLRPSADEPFIP